MTAATVASAQDVEADKEETEVEAVEGEALGEGERVLEDAESGPEADYSWFQDLVDIEEIERTETAIRRLRELVQSTPEGDVQRAEYMFRLAELYYDRTRFYEQRAFQREDEAFAIKEENPQRAAAYERAAEDDLQQSEEYAQRAATLYGDLYQQYQGDFDRMDAVLFYLGSNFLQFDRKDAAQQIFEELARTYPRSPYLAQAMLMLGELAFDAGNMQQALDYYQVVIDSGNEAAYPYALYKKAWVQYNMADSTRGYEGALDTIYTAAEASRSGSQDRALALTRQILRDVPLFYSRVYDGDVAIDFLRELAPDSYLKLAERLALIYSDQAQYEDANTVYRELIALQPESFKTVGYQTQIVRNTRPTASEQEIVREIRRLVSLFNQAQSYEDATEETVADVRGQIELLLRQVATTYHREAQVTKNERYYALAFSLYEDYVNNFGDNADAYPMWFYYAELLYRNEDYEKAAEAYDRVFELGGGDGKHDTDATHGACLSYSKTVDFAGPRATGSEAEESQVNDEDLPPVPEPKEIPPKFENMLSACDRFLAQEGDAETEAEIEYAIAYIYYDYDHLDEAATRFGELATTKDEVDPERASLAAELMLDSFALQREWGEMRRWIERLQQSALATGEFGERLQTIKEQVSFKECRTLQVDENYDDAARCFVDFVNQNLNSELVDRAIYNAGVSFREADNIDFSIAMFEQLPQLAPDSELVPDTLYELGQTFRRLAVYDEAARYFEEYVDTVPDGEYAVEALASASQFRQGLGDYSKAMQDIERFIRVVRGEEDDEQAIAEARYQMAKTQESAGDVRRAINEYMDFIRQGGTTAPSRALQAYVAIADLYADARREDYAYDFYEDTVEFYEGLDEEQRAKLENAGLDAAAKAQFMLADKMYERWSEMDIEGRTEQQIRDKVTEKLELAGETEEAFDKVVTEFRRPGWAIAALTRMGQMYHSFFDELISAPVPPGLDPLVEEEYRTEIENQAAARKQVAMDRYMRAIEIARDEGWFNEYSSLAARKLQELDPSFAAGSEIRTEPGFDSVNTYFSSFAGLEEEQTVQIGGGGEEAAE
jgi:tetratricopeptide (TPR) repeat protein